MPAFGDLPDDLRVHCEKRLKSLISFADRCGADTPEKIRLLFTPEISTDRPDLWPTVTSARDAEYVIEALGLAGR